MINVSNSAPISNAGKDQKIECASNEGALIELDGSGSRDPDGDPLTYNWTWPGGSFNGVKTTIELPLGTTTVTLAVNNGKTTSTDSVNITIEDSSSPMTSVTGNDDTWHNTNLILTLSASDHCTSVKELHYTINNIENIVLSDSASFAVTGEGINTVTYFAVDNFGNKEEAKSFIVKIDKTPPILTLLAEPSILWPPDHKIIDVLINGGTEDLLSGLQSVVFNVIDEYGIIQPPVYDFNKIIPLEAWRDGMDFDGRKYIIRATATDLAGNTSISSTIVTVPHENL